VRRHEAAHNGWARWVAWCAALVVTLGAVGGCGSLASRPRLRLSVVAPTVVNVSLALARRGRDAGHFTIVERPDDDAGSPDASDRPVPFTLTVDARDLDGVATLRTAAGTCEARMPVFHCTGTVAYDRAPVQGYRIVPVKGARAGATGVIRYTLTSPHAPTRTGRITVLIGQPVLKVEQPKSRTGLLPGSATPVPIAIRNTGDGTARGVTVSLKGVGGSLTPAVRHRNCRYYAGAVDCDFPRTVIPPGRTYTLRFPENLLIGRQATHSAISLSASPYAPPPPSRPQAPYQRGHGPATELVPVSRSSGAPASAVFTSSAYVAIDALNTADISAIGATVRGPVGSRITIHVGVRDNGPGELSSYGILVEFHAPAGTTVVGSPYSAEAEGEQGGQECRAYTAAGAPMTAEAYQRQPSAPVYRCGAHLEAVGDYQTIAFTLRIDSRAGHSGGWVTVRDSDAHVPDVVTRNNTARVAVRVTPGPSWATERALVSLAFGVVLLAGAFAARRLARRRALTRRLDAKT
jgi:hypothetical protein